MGRKQSKEKKRKTFGGKIKYMLCEVYLFGRLAFWFSFFFIFLVCDISLKVVVRVCLWRMRSNYGGIQVDSVFSKDRKNLYFNLFRICSYSFKGFKRSVRLVERKKKAKKKDKREEGNGYGKRRWCMSKLKDEFFIYSFFEWRINGKKIAGSQDWKEGE